MGLGRPRKSGGDGCWENGWQIRSPITRKVDLGFQESVFLLMVFLLCFIIWYCLKMKERERERSMFSGCENARSFSWGGGFFGFWVWLVSGFSAVFCLCVCACVRERYMVLREKRDTDEWESWIVFLFFFSFFNFYFICGME